MLEVYRQIRLAAEAPADMTVVIGGESGTGKELIARAIHKLSDRATKPFVAFNCSAIPELLIEAELFGHVKGSFTGADHDSPGLFIQADKGTIFIDEVAEMSDAMQVKLLRVIQEREVQRIGCTKPPRQIDVRFIAASNQCLKTLTEQKRFREDLFFRLCCGIHIQAPSLRDRPEDIPELVVYFLEKKAVSRPTPTIEDDAMQLLCSYKWPGNVRELESRIQLLVVGARGQSSITAKAVIDALKDPRDGATVTYISPVQARGPRIVMPKDGTMDIFPGETRKEWHRRIDGIGLELTHQTYKSRAGAAERLGITLSALKKAMRKIKRRILPETDPGSGPAPTQHKPAA
jgi:transcriptional regulator with PAS, ATPase and Fis domain